MKNKLTILIMAIAITILLCVVFVACDENGDKSVEVDPVQNSNQGQNSDSAQEKTIIPVGTSVDASKLTKKGLELEYHGNTAVIVGFSGDYATINIPEIVVYNSKEYVVTAIGPEVFKDTQLSNITLPKTLVSIGRGAFAGTPLYSINLESNIRSIEAEAFKGCTNLTDLKFNAGVSEIADSVFEKCSKINSFVIPETVTKIGDRAFAYCYIKNITFPSGLKSIGDYAFYCALKCELNLPSTLESIGENAFQQCTFQDDIVIPNNVSSIGRAAFVYADFKSCVWPENAEVIEDSVFSGSDLERITLPEGVKTIRRHAFMLTDIVSIVIPSTVEEIEDDAFSSASYLVEVVNLSSLDIIKGYTSNGRVANYALDVYNTLDYESKLSYSEDGAIYYTKGTDKWLVAFRDGLKLPLRDPEDMLDVVIANDVTCIKTYALFSSHVRKVTIPTSVVKIESSAFRNSIIRDIYYEGTIEQWQEINLDVFWRGSDTTIHCSNGDYEEVYSGIY